MIRGNRWFPIVLVLLMAILTVWLDQVSRLGDSSRDLSPSKPEFVADAVVATRFDLNGKVLERMTADRMWQYPNQHDLFYDTGYLQSFQDGALLYTVQAETGRYNTRTRLAFFDKRVNMIKEPLAGQPLTTMVTTAMTLDTDKRYASSQTPVTVHYGNSTADAVGFNYDNRAGLLHLLSKARVTYEK
ncbi:LPS export ABC transporter periplasmic protein LptC [Paludibacterium yongneupense]|uniref:LPS export ABC transporter periplasmic protein LptC n=1 Tax=Paludibacterium yongneupense TaxID=400061 RepID=UPI0004261F60|nr:LPS export ABC transporter periplasmic protein LptC [Paludibacterium yongneupense]